MDYILQCLGDCAPQTPCCFASTLLETPNAYEQCGNSWLTTQCQHLAMKVVQ